MNGTIDPPPAPRRGRRPASLADSQLDHLENMVGYLVRDGAAAVQHEFDHEYWEKRIRALEATYELIESQQKRIAKLRDRLASAALSALKRRSAA
jgi:hypothetical protein